MKVCQKLVLSAGLATVVVGQLNMTPPWTSTYNFTILEGDDALSYLFNYNPSVPHHSDTPYRQSWTSGDELPAPETYRPWYDVHYVSRLCIPSFYTGEAYAKLDPHPCRGMSAQECKEYQDSWEYKLKTARQISADSPYPCERLTWLKAECGVGSEMVNEDGLVDWTKQDEGKGSFGEQHECLCNSDYWAAQEACNDCQNLHIGDATYKANGDKAISLHRSSVCGDAPIATKGLRAYEQAAWEAVFTGHNYNRGWNYTIVSDGAQNKTDVSFYMTESVDFVPATIQEPAFTRTADGKAVVMTPGLLMANAKAKAQSAPKATEPSATATAGTATATGGATSAATSEAGAAELRVPKELVAAMVGALFVL